MLNLYLCRHSHSFETFLKKKIQLSYLPCIMWFDLPVSVSCPVYRNVNDEESLSLVSISNGSTSLL